MQLCNGIADPDLCTRIFRAEMCSPSESIQALCPVLCGTCTGGGQMTMSPSSAPSSVMLMWDENSLFAGSSSSQGDSGNGLSTVSMIMMGALGLLFVLLGAMQLKMRSIAGASSNTLTKRVFSHEDLAKAMQMSDMSKWQGLGQWQGNGQKRQTAPLFSDAASYVTAHPGPLDNDQDHDNDLVKPYARAQSSDVMQERMQKRMASRIDSRIKTYESIVLNDNESDVEYEMAAPKSRLGTAKVSYSTIDDPDINKHIEDRNQMISALSDARDTAETVLEVEVLNMVMDTGTADADANEVYDNLNDNQTMKKQPSGQGGQASMEVYAVGTDDTASFYEVASPTRGKQHGAVGGSQPRALRRNDPETIYEVAFPVTSPNPGNRHKGFRTQQGSSTEEALYQVASPVMSPVLSPLNGGTMRAKLQDLLRNEGSRQIVTSPDLSPPSGMATTAVEYLACSESGVTETTSSGESQSDDDELYPVSVQSSSSYAGGTVVLSPNALHDEMYAESQRTDVFPPSLS